MQTVKSRSTSTEASTDRVLRARERLLRVYSLMNRYVVGREECVRALLLALVAGEHVVFISPPGTAKTYMVNILSKLLNARFYKFLLTRFTDYSELFGPVDIPSLVKGVYRRNWSGIVKADIVFLDEVFKANSAILNSLLSIMQERVVYDPLTGESVPVQLWTMVGASNEVPCEEELRALYDRFSVRVFFDYLSDSDVKLRGLEASLAARVSQGVKPVAGMEDVRVLHRYAMELLRMQVKQLGAPLYKVYHFNAGPLVEALASRGIVVSDRTYIEKLPKLYAAYLALFGVSVDNVMNAVFEILPYLAWDRSQLRDIRKVIEDSLGEVGELARKVEEARRLMLEGSLGKARELLEEVLSFDVESLANKPWLKARAEAIIKTAWSYHTQLTRQLQQLKETVERGG